MLSFLKEWRFLFLVILEGKINPDIKTFATAVCDFSEEGQDRGFVQ